MDFGKALYRRPGPFQSCVHRQTEPATDVVSEADATAGELALDDHRIATNGLWKGPDRRPHGVTDVGTVWYSSSRTPKAPPPLCLFSPRRGERRGLLFSRLVGILLWRFTRAISLACVVYTRKLIAAIEWSAQGSAFGGLWASVIQLSNVESGEAVTLGFDTSRVQRTGVQRTKFVRRRRVLRRPVQDARRSGA